MVDGGRPRVTRRDTLTGTTGLLAGLAGLALAGCESGAGQPAGTQSGAGGTAPASGPDREVVLAISRDLANGPQDPFFAHSSAMVWEPLVGLDDALKPVPVLAERWDLSPEGTTWTFKLRPGVTFSDGAPFDADAVVANVQRYVRISPRPSPFFTMDVKVGYGDLAAVQKVDPLTVAFRLNAPAPAMPATMSNFFSAMFQPAGFAEGGSFAGLPVATGPFKLVDWKRDESLLLERNERYWGPKPAVKRIRLRSVPDANARVSAILAKEVDAVAELGALLPPQALQLKGQPGITVGADPITITQRLALNCSKPPFDDVRLRRVVAMAIDREAIVKDLVLGYATAGQSLLSPISKQWYSPKGAPKYDPAAARALAADVLGPRRVDATLLLSTSAGQARPYKAMAELFQQVLRPLGINITIQSLENAAVTDLTNRGEWHLRFAQLGWANGDPDFIFDQMLKSSGSFNAAQQGGYKNSEADALVAAGRVERDEKKRFAIYERLQELAGEDVPVLSLYHEHAPYAFRDTIAGLKQRVTYQPTLDAIKLVR
jgi:peptide/nickel transport system substrate-binding protein